MVDSNSTIEISFGSLDALAEVAVGDEWEERIGGGVKVSMAEAWGKSRYTLSLNRYSYGLVIAIT